MPKRYKRAKQKFKTLPRRQQIAIIMKYKKYVARQAKRNAYNLGKIPEGGIKTKYPGTVYLLQFDKPLKHSKHYLGFAERGNLEKRLKAHRVGKGSAIMNALQREKIGFKMVRKWENVDRNFERLLKKRKEAPYLNPLEFERRKKMAMKKRFGDLVYGK